jgi:phosphoribosyl 1,2-cyclic phosphodiesterase
MARQRRNSRPIEDLPGLFDGEFDNDAYGVIAASGVSAHERLRRRLENTEIALDESAAQRTDGLRYMSFGSGSSGNCSYLGTRSCGVLIDAGVDNNKVTKALADNGIDINTIKGILLTHDHADHVRYAYSILRHNKHMRLYTTPRVINGMLKRHNISRRINDYHTAVYKEFEIHIGDLCVTPFDISHDGSDNMGFSIKLVDQDPIFVIATDMGVITERADHYMRQANYLMIESNYDLDMLQRGRYPEYLKARIKSPTGHMNNTDAAEYLVKIYSDKLRRIFLCHLSHDNNTPEIALTTARQALEAAGITVGDGSDTVEMRDRAVQLIALPRYDCTDLIVLR